MKNNIEIATQTVSPEPANDSGGLHTTKLDSATSGAAANSQGRRRPALLRVRSLR